MRTVTLAVAVILAAALAGCVDDVLPGGTEWSTVTKLDESAAFDGQDLLDPANPDQVGKTEDYEFVVGSNERNLGVSFEVTFNQSSPSSDLPSGNVTVDLNHPDGSRHWDFSRSGSESAFFSAPPPGTWNVRVEARGQGTYSVVVRSETPRPA